MRTRAIARPLHSIVLAPDDEPPYRYHMLKWYKFGLLVPAFASIACGQEGASNKPVDECALSSERQSCEFKDGYCAHATAECVAGTPNQLGPCICERPGLLNVGAATSFPILAGAFGGSRFYWSTYIFVSGAPVSTINSDPTGITITVPNHAYGLRATADAIYVRGDSQLFAFTLAGKALPSPTEEEAFPPTGSRIVSDETGLHLNGTLIAGPSRSWSETADGVYTISANLPVGVDYVPFADPSQAHLALIEGGDEFQKIWVSGTNAYTVLVTSDGLLQLSYADLSIVGKQSTN